jgi:hypothetical protein
VRGGAIHEAAAEGEENADVDNQGAELRDEDPEVVKV